MFSITTGARVLILQSASSAALRMSIQSTFVGMRTHAVIVQDFGEQSAYLAGRNPGGEHNCLYGGRISAWMGVGHNGELSLWD
jgi:hypothetical protein